MQELNWKHLQIYANYHSRIGTLREQLFEIILHLFLPKQHCARDLMCLFYSASDVTVLVNDSDAATVLKPEKFNSHEYDKKNAA